MRTSRKSLQSIALSLNESPLSLAGLQAPGSPCLVGLRPALEATTRTSAPSHLEYLRAGAGNNQESQYRVYRSRNSRTAVDQATTTTNTKINGVTMKTNFQLVADMNTAFGNPKGDPLNIDWERIRNQSISIGHEFLELMSALGANPHALQGVKERLEQLHFSSINVPDLALVRDSLVDINVFSYGVHHLMGVDADRDFKAVIDGVMTRFIKDPDDLINTSNKHSAKGVTDVYFEGAYPTMVMKSAVDQPDAPKGKFLKSASYKEPTFYDVSAPVPAIIYLNAEAQTLLDAQNQRVAYKFVPKEALSDETRTELAKNQSGKIEYN
jgi:hypothetical protein